MSWWQHHYSDPILCFRQCTRVRTYNTLYILECYHSRLFSAFNFYVFLNCSIRKYSGVEVIDCYTLRPNKVCTFKIKMNVSLDGLHTNWCTAKGDNVDKLQKTIQVPSNAYYHRSSPVTWYLCHPTGDGFKYEFLAAENRKLCHAQSWVLAGIRGEEVDTSRQANLLLPDTLN